MIEMETGTWEGVIILILTLISATVVGLAPYRPPEAHSRTTRNAELKPRRWRLLRVRRCKAPRYGTA